MSTIIKVFYGDTPLYVCDLYQLCVNDGRYDFTLSENVFLAHDFPSLESALEFADLYLSGHKAVFIQHETGRF